jgi:hypothetical protein
MIKEVSITTNYNLTEIEGMNAPIAVDINDYRMRAFDKEVFKLAGEEYRKIINCTMSQQEQRYKYTFIVVDDAKNS